jgi:hypothetical protein
MFYTYIKLLLVQGFHVKRKPLLYTANFYLFKYTKSMTDTSKCVITAALENVPHVLKTSIHSLWYFLQFFEMFVGRCGHKLVSCYLTVVRTSSIIVVDSSFKKSPQKVRWHEIWGLWWSKPTPDNSLTISVTAVVIFAVWTVAPSGSNQLPSYFLPAE